MAQLRFELDGRPPLIVPLRSTRLVVGRSDTSCDVALPGEAVSRVHFVLDRRAEGWVLADRSRHGTEVNGARVATHLLRDGDLVTVGGHRARFEATADDASRRPPATTFVRDVACEQLLDVVGDAWTVSAATLRFVRGPRVGDHVPLTRSVTVLGGPDSPLDLPAPAALLRVVRGRALVEPLGEGAAMLAGERVREPTPVLAGEEIRIGPHGFVVDHESVDRSAPERPSFGELQGNSPAMRRLFGVLERVAASDAVVLVTGESGTGKELAARGLHEASDRAGGPMVAVNCAAVADPLFESELFGHEKGAFTGATGRRDGAFQQAHGGTLFLDEIGELKPDLQAKLLRALESGEVRRVGGDRVEYPDVRLIAATNRDLAAEVRAGRFRSDLFYRVAVVTLWMPPLRERPEDIPVLARHLLDAMHPGAVLTDEAVARLLGHDWPGNVRELRNALTRAWVLHGPRIDGRALTLDQGMAEAPRARPAAVPRVIVPEDEDRARIVAALAAAGGNRTRAARDLGMPRSSLLYKLQRYGIS
jgi:transcriptional regulator with AAA-type ATPase domain